MYDSQNELENTFDVTQIVRLSAGIFLVFLGVAIAFWVLFSVYNILNSPDQVALIGKIVPTNPAYAIIRTDFGEIELPHTLFVGFAYIILFFLYSLLASITTTLIRSGSNLLQSDLKLFVTKLTQELKKHRQTSKP